MAGEITGVGKNAGATMSQGIYEQLSKLSGSESTELKQVVGKAMEVLAGSNLKVTKSEIPGTDSVAEKKTNGATGTPALDNPDDAQVKEVNLEKLVSYLELDNEERQTEMAKDRIELQKESLDSEHTDRMAKIDESIEKMKDAETSSILCKVFTYIGAALAIAAAVALTVVTGGVAAGFAIAGAVLAVSALVMNETGASEAITKALAEHMQSAHGMSKNDAKMAAALIFNLSIMALQIGCSVGSMVGGIMQAGATAAQTGAQVANVATKAASTASNAASTASTTAKTIQNAISVASTATGSASLGSTGVSTYMTHRSETSKADTTELEKFITQLQQRLEESQEELQKLLEQVENGTSIVADMISSATDTSSTIAQNIGQMA